MAPAATATATHTQYMPFPLKFFHPLWPCTVIVVDVVVDVVVVVVVVSLPSLSTSCRWFFSWVIASTVPPLNVTKMWSLWKLINNFALLEFCAMCVNAEWSVKWFNQNQKNYTLGKAQLIYLFAFIYFVFFFFLFLFLLFLLFSFHASTVFIDKCRHS